jgi:hypothetical protein
LLFSILSSPAYRPFQEGVVMTDLLAQLKELYHRWAEANNIVVLYPQLTTRQFNPEGCWDWWGYSGSDYFVQSGPQMRANGHD